MVIVDGISVNARVITSFQPGDRVIISDVHFDGWVPRLRFEPDTYGVDSVCAIINSQSTALVIAKEPEGLPWLLVLCEGRVGWLGPGSLDINASERERDFDQCL